MTTLSDTYYLKRAGQFTNPRNSNDRLPLVWGDLTDGSFGVWEAPVIDTVNYVCCFAANSVLPVAAGNSVSVYSDDELVAPASYTFSENDATYDNCATITFDSSFVLENQTITVKGKGAVLTGTTLMENIVDIVEDFLGSDLVDWSGSFDDTKKAIAHAQFEAAGYVAAGVLEEDAVIWETLQRMMASFLGSVFLSAAGGLILSFDTLGGGFLYSSVIRAGELELLEANIKRDNLINRCPSSYAYNYAQREFASHSTGTDTEDATSQGIYGVVEPNEPYPHYWCRDLDTVEAVQEVLIERFSRPVWLVRVKDFTYKRARLDPGDRVAATIKRLYSPRDRQQLVNQVFKIVSTRPDLTRGSVELTLQDDNAWMTTLYKADGSVQADGLTLAGGERDITEY